MPYFKKKGRTLKRYKPSFRKRKKTPLYKQIGRIWRQKTHYTTLESSIFLNWPRMNAAGWTGTTAVAHITGEGITKQYCIAINMIALVWDIVVYTNNNPWGADNVTSPNATALNNIFSSQYYQTSASGMNWLNVTNQDRGNVNRKLDQVTLDWGNYWTMKTDIEISPTFQSTRSGTAAFFTTQNEYIGESIVGYNFYIATDPYYILAFNTAQSMNNGQRNEVFINYLETFKHTSEYCPDTGGKRGKFIRLKNPALPVDAGKTWKMCGSTVARTEVSNLTVNSGWAYLIIEVNIAKLPDNPTVNPISYYSLNIGKLKIKRHIAFTKRNASTTLLGQQDSGNNFAPTEGVPGLQPEDMTKSQQIISELKDLEIIC